MRYSKFHPVLALIGWLARGAAVSTAAEIGTSEMIPRHQGGLFVWAGGAEPGWKDWAQQTRSRPMLLQILLADEKTALEARQWVETEELGGRVTVEFWDGPILPYADQLVSCVFLNSGSKSSEAEAQRVLRPFGELIVPTGPTRRRVVKPRPQGQDDWTHWRHGADRNPVSRDSVVTVPDRIQWLLPAAAMSERSHLVTANGRIFSQDRETLTARDACNGLPLWRAKLKKGREFEWEWTVKVSALIVAVGERVFALTDDGKYKSLDAATGAVVRTFDVAGAPYDAVVVERTGAEATLVTCSDDAVRAFGAESGQLLWQEPADHAGTLIASTDTVFYIIGNDRRGAAAGTIVARELVSGRMKWGQPYDWARRTEQGAFGHDLIVFEMRNPVDWRERYEKDPKQKEEDRFALAVINAQTGALVQKVRGTGTSARHGEFRAAFWHGDHLVTEAILKDGINVVEFNLDDFTKPARKFRANDVGDRGFGHCYPPVLTERYYLNGQMNFVDLATGSALSNPITRGGCNTARSGYVPANGLIYTFPKHCICYPMLDGNVALAPKDSAPMPDENPLVRGPGWPAPEPAAGEALAADWPTFRGDAWRSGGTPSDVPEELQLLWTAQVAAGDPAQPLAAEWTANPFLSGPITAPTVAEGCAFTAQSDLHRLVALDAAAGKERWRFTTGGRIDTPPTIHQGMCLLGCRDGWIYNLRTRDGSLIWKLRAAPQDRRIVVHGQVESPWGVTGSILVTGGVAFAAAGLHPNSDGGIRVLAFEPASGKILWQSKFDDLGFNSPWPAPYDPRVSRPESDPWRTIRPLEYAYQGIPVRDGDAVAVSRCLFDLKTGKADLRKTKGYLHNKMTGTWLPRSAWRYATEREGDPQAVSLGASVFGTVPSASKLFRVDFKPDAVFNDDWVHAEDPKQEVAKEAFSINKIHALGPNWESPSQDSRRAFNRAMLAAGNHLFTVTPRGNLTIHSIADGRLLREMKLEMPAWNGIAAAGGRLYVSTMTGKVLCFARGESK